MYEKYWFGVNFCYPEGNLTGLWKFATKTALTLSGTPHAGLISGGIAKLYKPLFGGLPIDSSLIITDSYLEVKPNKFATFFADGIEKFTIPIHEVIGVDKTFNFAILHHVIKVQLRDTELKFFITAYSVSVGEIVRNLKKLI
jgi:hypothetical protein